MGTTKSIMTVRDADTGKVKIVEGGWTFSQKQKAKFLGKDPEKLTVDELKTSLSDLKAKKK